MAAEAGVPAVWTVRLAPAAAGAASVEGLAWLGKAQLDPWGGSGYAGHPLEFAQWRG